MKCELKLIARDVKEAIKFLPTLGGIAFFIEILIIEIIIIIPTFILVGINAVIGTVIAFIIACFGIVYYNARNECKELEAT